ncbi:hypothetical protein CYMTET_28907 [Cymbomonas tetramitiformis]|uniref:DUF1826 domain-containing protein n=1 Tax=Cymbomonas tetramitiformis TaxID=36881 RepID=A0AAE0FM17_9CHLO|nr:hypothetical protein CYMTET_28907 [Cymbomonas tetramitiformis]
MLALHPRPVSLQSVRKSKRGPERGLSRPTFSPRKLSQANSSLLLVTQEVEENVSDVLLKKIQSPNVNVVVQKRRVPSEVASLCRSLERVPDFTVSQELCTDTPDVSSLNFEAHLPEGPELDAFCQELTALVQNYGKLTGQRLAKVSVTLTRETTCSRLHIDHCGLRAMCTYHGLGTEWLGDELLNRLIAMSLRDGGNWLSDFLKTLVSPSSMVQAAEGDVVFLKGNKWPGNQGKAIVHRSPDMANASSIGVDPWRMVIKVDDDVHDDCSDA